MFGWRRKTDGFVWHDYVRTTILVRREQRRQKIEDVRVHAIDGLKNVGRQGAALGIAGASAAGRGAAYGVMAALTAGYDFIVVGSRATGLWLADRTGPLGPAIRDNLPRLGKALRRPSVTTPVALVGLVCGLSAAARYADHGFDIEAVITSTIAALAALLIAAPFAADIVFARGHTIRFGSIPGLSSLRPEVGSALRLGAMLVAGVALLGWLVPALTSGTDAVPRAAEGKPVLVAASGHIEGRATALAGDELKVGSTRLRLFGIEAPEAGQVCGSGSKAGSCAALARAALQRLIAGKDVACDVSNGRAGQPASATCKVNGADIAGQLVRGGSVFATTGLFATYASAEREAKANRAGLWRTDLPRPSDFRAKAWADAKDAAPDGCPIKGVLVGGSKTYLQPWSANYDRARIKPTNGERWFCSEEEARSAGFKAAEG